MVANMYWNAGNPIVEWYCPRCGKTNNGYIYTTDRTEPCEKDIKESMIGGNNGTQ